MKSVHEVLKTRKRNDKQRQKRTKKTHKSGVGEGSKVFWVFLRFCNGNKRKRIEHLFLIYLIILICWWKLHKKGFPDSKNTKKTQNTLDPSPTPLLCVFFVRFCRCLSFLFRVFKTLCTHFVRYFGSFLCVFTVVYRFFFMFLKLRVQILCGFHQQTKITK